MMREHHGTLMRGSPNRIACHRVWRGAPFNPRYRVMQLFHPISVITVRLATPIPALSKGRKYLAPGLFGPCGYGFPAILGAKIGCPDVPVVGFAGDGAFGISMNEMTACAREDWPAITMIIFRNYQWGAEKRNTTLWYDNNFVGTELDPHLSYANVAEGCGLKGVSVTTMDELTNALKTAIDEQMNNKKTTFIEVVLNQELGEPFRRDAMKKPVEVAGIDPADMRPQQPA
jgi:sulfoacetaldehyde acetyltransferase